MTYCLEPMTTGELKQLVGQNFEQNFCAEVESVIAPLRKYIDQGRPPSMGKELWEYFVTDSIVGAEWCGAGKGIADVRIGDNISIDVKSLQYKGSWTTEASLHQRLLTEESTGFYDVFDSKSLFDLLVQGWLNKVRSAGQYYLLAIIRNHDLECRLVGLKVVNTVITYQAEDITPLKASLVVDKLIDPELAQIKLYRGKTRMEVRFNKKLFADSRYSLPIYKGIN